MDSVQQIHACVTAKTLIRYYDSIGVNVRHLIPSGQTFYLYQQKNHLLQWTPSLEGDSSFYHQLSQNKWYYQSEKPEFRYSKKYLDISRSTLEIGCAVGNYQDLVSLSDYTGIDLNKDAVQQARGKGYNCLNLSLDDFVATSQQTYDQICAFQVLEHLSNPSTFFKQVSSLLSEDGFLLISVPAASSYLSFSINNPLNTPPHHQTVWTDEALREFPAEYGLELVDLVHLPLETQHNPRFFENLVKSLVDSNSLFDRLISRLAIILLVKLSKEILISPLFGIRGHTVLCCYKKAS